MTMPNSQGGTTSAAESRADPATVPTGAGSESTEGARGQIRQVKDQVVDKARSTFRDARDKATSSLGDSRRQAADQIGGIATAFHSAGDHLRSENQERVANLADSVAGQVDKMAGYLRDADLQRMARDIESLARRQPALVFGAAFALGILGARFLKSSDSGQRRRFDTDYDDYGEYDELGSGFERGPEPRTGLGGMDAGA